MAIWSNSLFVYEYETVYVSALKTEDNNNYKNARDQLGKVLQDASLNTFDVHVTEDYTHSIKQTGRLSKINCPWRLGVNLNLSYLQRFNKMNFEIFSVSVVSMVSRKNLMLVIKFIIVNSLLLVFVTTSVCITQYYAIFQDYKQLSTNMFHSTRKPL